MKGLLDQRKRDNEELYTRITTMEVTITQYKTFEDKCKDQDKYISSLQQQIEAYKSKIREYENRLAYLQTVELKNQELENKIVMLTQEIERLNKVI